MPGFEEMDCLHTAVRFPMTGKDRFGEYTHGSPEEIPVRWVPSRTDMKAPDGSRITVDVQIKALQDLSIGDRVWLGELIDWMGTGSGDVDSELMEVVARNVCDDFSRKFTEYEYGLNRVRGVASG